MQAPDLYIHISLTASTHVFLMDAFLSSLNPLSLSLFLASLSSPSLLLHQSFSNSLCSAEPQLQTYILKEPKLSHVRKKPQSLICPALPHTLPLSASLQPSIHPSPCKLLFVYHHWRILASGCCIRISSLNSCGEYVCVCVRACVLSHREWCYWFVSHFTGRWFIPLAYPRSRRLAVDYSH